MLDSILPLLDKQSQSSILKFSGVTRTTARNILCVFCGNEMISMGSGRHSQILNLGSHCAFSSCSCIQHKQGRKKTGRSLRIPTVLAVPLWCGCTWNEQLDGHLSLREPFIALEGFCNLNKDKDAHRKPDLPTHAFAVTKRKLNIGAWKHC